MIGDRIKQRRIELGLTQQDVADALGLKSKATINKMESNIIGVSVKKIPQLANILKCTESYLLELDNESSWELGFALDEEMYGVFTAYFFADEQTREMVKRILSPNYGKYPER